MPLSSCKCAFQKLMGTAILGLCGVWHLSVTFAESGHPLAETYSESPSGSWMQLSSDVGFYFEDRHLSRGIAQAVFAGGVAAFASKMLDLSGCNDTLALVTRSASLVFSGCYLFMRKQHGKQQKRLTPINIVDNRLLAKYLSIDMDWHRLPQRLVFRMPPSSLTGLSEYSLKGTTPLERLVKSMIRLDNDSLEIRWRGKRTPVEIILENGQGQTLVVSVPAWGKTLSQMDTGNKLPEIIGMLQDNGLTALESLFQCLQNWKGKEKSCGDGLLMLQSHPPKKQYLLYEVKEHNLILSPLKGKRKGDRYLLPLSHCDKGKLCIGASMAWTNNNFVAQTFYMPANVEQVELYSKAVNPSEIIKGSSSPARPVMMTIEPWITDVLTTMLYPASYLLVEHLLTRGLNAFGVAGTSVVGSALRGMGWDPQNNNDGGGGGGGDGGGGAYNNKGGSPEEACQDEESAVATITPPGLDIFTRKQITNQYTLPHRGNNCFLNAALAYLAHVLSSDELTAIKKNSYISLRKKRIPKKQLLEEQLKERQLLEKAPEFLETQLHVFKNFRNTFVALMRAIVSMKGKKELSRRYQAFYVAFNEHINPYGCMRYALPAKMSDIRVHEDVHEFLSIVLDEFYYQYNDGGNVNFEVNFESVKQIGDGEGNFRSESENGNNFITVGMPTIEEFKKKEISNINELIDYECSRTEDGDGNVVRSCFSHREPNELNHVNIQFKLYHHNHEKNNGKKIVGVIRRLLKKNDGIINLPVHTESKVEHIAMQPAAMILHSGTIGSGHYITAVRSNNDWIIHDDMVGNPVRLTANNATEHSSIDVLFSYLEANKMDPYIINYRRH